MALNAKVSQNALQQTFLNVFDDAVESYLNDGSIDDSEKRAIARFIQYSGMSQAALNANKSLEKVLQAEVIQDILNGRKPQPKITIQGDFPFLLGKSETMLWLFRNVTMYEQKVKREYVGRSRGMSFRIMKGVYYRTGGFKGHPIESTYMHKVGVGSVCMTDKHIYFSSPEKSVKIPYSKIISLDPYSDGIGLQKDGASSKPIIFQGVNSWFCQNVISNLI